MFTYLKKKKRRKSNLGSLIILMECPSGLVLLVGAARACELKYAYVIWTMLSAAARNDAHFLTIGKAYAAYVTGFERRHGSSHCFL